MPERTGEQAGGLPQVQTARLFGYPTCEASDGTGGRVSAEVGGYRPNGVKRQITLGTVASLFGWPTTTASDGKGKDAPGPAGGVSLCEVAKLAGWPTPMAGSPATETYNAAGNTDSSRKTVELLAGCSTPRATDDKGAMQESPTTQQRVADGKANLSEQVVTLTGWSTPAVRDAKGANTLPRAVRSPGKPEDQLANQAAHLLTFEPGTDSESSSAGTASPGASLNPYFSAWLMGYSESWLDCLPQSLPTRNKR